MIAITNASSMAALADKSASTPPWLLNDVAPHQLDWVPALDSPLLAGTGVFPTSSDLLKTFFLITQSRAWCCLLGRYQHG